MYPSDNKFEVSLTPEVAAFRRDTESLGMVNDLENWYVTESWVEKFQEHLRQLLPLAEGGNVLAQYSVAVIHMCGYLYSSEEEFEANWFSVDGIEATKWWVLAARQGYMCALDNLGSTGVGPDADLVRAVHTKIAEEIKEGKSFPPGETWRRVFGNADES